MFFARRKKDYREVIVPPVESNSKGLKEAK
jgi:hypothetical protein